MTSDWKYVYASAAGTYHKRIGKPCQDSYIIREIYRRESEPLLAIVVSDGAGSARYSEIGSKLACSLLMEELKEFIQSGKNISELTRETIGGMLIELQQEVLKYAVALAVKVDDFACTVLCTVIGIDRAVFFQIGDGAIVVSKREEPEQYFPVFWPANGEYENTTYFAVGTQCSLSYMDYKIIQGVVDNVAVFTDGLQRLTLHYQSRAAHAPFFKPIFKHLKLTPENCQNELINSLTVFLDSDKVNNRTDDDKTLIAAVRCDV